MRSLRRIMARPFIALMAVLLAVIGITGTAAAASSTPHVPPAVITPMSLATYNPSQPFNTEMNYGAEFDANGQYTGIGSQTNAYAPGQPYTANTYGWYNGCNQEDCGGLQATKYGVVLSLKSDEHFVSAYVYYSSSDGYQMSAGGAWDGKGAVQYTTPDTAFGHTTNLKISFISVLVMRDGFDPVPQCQGVCKGGGGMK